MPWFQKICRNAGLAVRGVMHPDGASRKTTVNRTVEEKKISETVTLRRTTIEEIETKPAEADERRED